MNYSFFKFLLIDNFVHINPARTQSPEPLAVMPNNCRMKNCEKTNWWKIKKKYFDKLILYTGIGNVLLTAKAFYFLEDIKIALATIWYSVLFYLIYYSFVILLIYLTELLDRTLSIRKVEHNELYFKLFSWIIILIPLLYPIFLYSLVHLY